MPQQLMLDKNNKPYFVEEKDIDAAINEGGLEPSFDMTTPEGQKTYVRKKDYQAAIKSGLRHSHELVAEREADERYKAGLKNTQVNPLESAARGFSNATTAGFADEIQAAAKNPKGALKSLGGVVGMDMTGDQDVRGYQRARDDYRAADDESYNQNPVSHVVGNVAGLVGGAGASSVPQTIAGAAKLGAGQGAVQGLGGSQADLAKGNVGRSAIDTAVGAGVGAGAGSLGQYLSNWAAKGGAGGLAEEFAYKAAGGQKADINKLYNKDPRQVGRTLLDEGAVKFGDRSSGDTMKGRVQSVIDKYSQKESDLLNSIDGTVNYSDVRGRVLGDIGESMGDAGVGNQKYAGALRSELDALDSNYAPYAIDDVLQTADLTPQQLLKMKSDYNKSGRFHSSTEAAPVEAARGMRRNVSNTLDDFVAQKTDDATSAGYKADRMKESDMYDALSSIEQGQQRRQANKMFGITDAMIGSGGVGASLANPAAIPAAVAIVGAKKLGENFGSSSSAVMLNEANKLIQRFGLGEGMKRLSNAVGPRLAEQLIQQLQQQTQGRE